MPSASPSPAATVVVVAYNSGAFLQPCIDALAAQSWQDFEAVVVDNASEDLSMADLVLPDARFRVLPLGFNAGFALANNRAAEASAAEFLVMLNPDTVADPGWLAALIAAARAHPEAASVGSLQLRLDDPQIMDGVGDVWHVAGLAWRAGEGKPSTTAPPDGGIFGPCAAAALYRREVFAAMGGFDERFFCYCEDVDLAYRLRLAGHGSVRASNAVVRHAGSGIAGRASDFALYHGHRNRIWTFIKNTPGGWFWALLPYHLAFNAWFLFRAWRRGFLPPMARAYKDAWAGRAPFLAERKRLRPMRSVGSLLPLMAWSPWSPWFRELRPKAERTALVLRQAQDEG